MPVALLLLAAHASVAATADAQTRASPPASIEVADGVAVAITSKDPSTEVYIAHGDVPGGAVPDPFERVGLTPVTLKLAPGTYTLESSSPTASTGHERFMVEQGRPLSIDVRSGNAGVRTIGGVLAGLGIVAMLLGVVAIVSFTSNDAHYNRFGIALPLLFAGAGGTGIGVTMAVAGATDVHVRLQDRPAPARPTSVVPALVWSF